MDYKAKCKPNWWSLEIQLTTYLNDERDRLRKISYGFKSSRNTGNIQTDDHLCSSLNNKKWSNEGGIIKKVLRAFFYAKRFNRNESNPIEMNLILSK